MGIFKKTLRLYRNSISAYTIPFNAQKLVNMVADKDKIELIKDWADYNQS